MRLRAHQALIEDKNFGINVGRLVGAALGVGYATMADEEADPKQKALAGNLISSALWFIEENDRKIDPWEAPPQTP